MIETDQSTKLNSNAGDISFQAPQAHVGIVKSVTGISKTADIAFFRDLVERNADELSTADILGNYLAVHFTEEWTLVAVRKDSLDNEGPKVFGPQRGVKMHPASSTIGAQFGLDKQFDFYHIRPTIAGLYNVHSASARKPLSREQRISKNLDLDFAGQSLFLKFLYRHKVTDAAVDAINKFRREIWKIQNPRDCNKARISYYQLKGGMNYGIGVNTEYMVAAFARAMAQNRTFVVPTTEGASNLGFYWAEDMCKHRSWLCYFHAFSKCNESHLGVRTYTELPDDGPDTDLMATTRVVKSIACPRKNGVVAADEMAKLALQYAPYQDEVRACDIFDISWEIFIT